MIHAGVWDWLWSSSGLLVLGEPRVEPTCFTLFDTPPQLLPPSFADCQVLLCIQRIMKAWASFHQEEPVTPNPRLLLAQKEKLTCSSLEAFSVFKKISPPMWESENTFPVGITATGSIACRVRTLQDIAWGLQKQLWAWRPRKKQGFPATPAGSHLLTFPYSQPWPPHMKSRCHWRRATLLLIPSWKEGSNLVQGEAFLWDSPLLQKWQLSKETRGRIYFSHTSQQILHFYPGHQVAAQTCLSTLTQLAEQRAKNRTWASELQWQN